MQDVANADLAVLSTYNPANMRNNCVFVTTAFLMRLNSVDELNEEIVKKMKTARPTGISTSSIPDVLEMTGRKFLWRTWKDPADAPRKDGSQVQVGNSMWRGEQFLFGEWNVKQIGICYKRISPKSGHCIVLKEGDPQKAADPPSYLDYQAATDGKDAWKDVKGDWKLAAAGKGNRVIGAFAILDEGDSGHEPLLQASPRTASGADLMSNTAAAVVQPAVGALGHALAVHATSAISGKRP